MNRARHAFWLSRVVGMISVLAVVAGTLGIGDTLGIGGRATPAGASTSSAVPPSPGYWLMAGGGAVYTFGTTNLGSIGGVPLAGPIVGSAPLLNGLGYWLVASDGGVFSFGDARFFGSTGGVRLNQAIVGMAATGDGKGYWLVASDGGVFSFGDARFFGSTGGVRLNQPIVGMAATGDGKGYWLVASDGGVFSFGDARFFGSTGGVRLNQPIVGMAATGDGKGYWLVASDGGVFSFGDARFFGSTGGVRLNQPIVGMAATGDGDGYWLVARDGGIFAFGDAPFLGSTGSNPGLAQIVSISSTAHGFTFPPRRTGYDISQWQCPSKGGSIPTTPQNVAIVQVSGGAINNPPNPCYLAEAKWAGPNISAYIFMDGLPSPAPSESLTGPAGTCHGNVNCESYNFGWYWARHWVAYSRSAGVDPTLWWLDVELGSWNLGGAYPASNAQVISGAIAGLRSSGVEPGIYSTWYQWPKIVGSLSFPGIALWVPGAGNVTGPGATATNFCTSKGQVIAGGVVTLVQYGYQWDTAASGPGSYSGPPSPYDLDYACG